MSGVLGGLIGSAIAPAGAFELIGTVALSESNQTAIQFTSIPQTYRHLQVRGVQRNQSTSSSVSINITIPGVAGSNYANHGIRGNGSTVSASGTFNQSLGLVTSSLSNGATANAFGVLIVDLLDYTSNAKTKTVRSLAGCNDAATPTNIIDFRSTLINTLDPVTALTLTVNGGSNSFIPGTRFSLYGIKG